MGNKVKEGKSVCACVCVKEGGREGGEGKREEGREGKEAGGEERKGNERKGEEGGEEKVREGRGEEKREEEGGVRNVCVRACVCKTCV